MGKSVQGVLTEDLSFLIVRWGGPQQRGLGSSGSYLTHGTPSVQPGTRRVLVTPARIINE